MQTYHAGGGQVLGPEPQELLHNTASRAGATDRPVGLGGAYWGGPPGGGRGHARDAAATDAAAPAAPGTRLYQYHVVYQLVIDQLSGGDRQ